MQWWVFSHTRQQSLVVPKKVLLTMMGPKWALAAWAVHTRNRRASKQELARAATALLQGGVRRAFNTCTPKGRLYGILRRAASTLRHPQRRRAIRSWLLGVAARMELR